MYISVWSISVKGWLPHCWPDMSLSACFSCAGCTCAWYGLWMHFFHWHHCCCGCLDSHLHDSAFSARFFYFLLLMEWLCLSAFLRPLLLTPCNIISLKCNNKAIVAYTTLLTVYVQACISCINLCAILHLHIYTRGMLWHGLCSLMVFTSFCQLIMYVLNVYILLTSKLLWTYHYTSIVDGILVF